MGGPNEGDDGRSEFRRLVDESEQLRTALEASEEELTRLAEDRDRLLRRLTAQSRELQLANAAYRQATAALERSASEENLLSLAVGQEHEELRVAFEEMQVLTEELEVANNSLHETNRVLDQRVAERTSELALKNLALAGTELRFRTLVEGMPQLVWRAIDGGEWTWASPQWTAYTGQSCEESLGKGWLDALHPDDREPTMDAWHRAAADQSLHIEARVFHAEENRYRHFRIRATRAVLPEGGVAEWLGTSTDVDDLLRLQERQKVLVAELQHRVRNILTVVRSVFSRTVEAGASMDDIADHFRGRLDSLARTQVIVTQSASGLVDLENLIRDELLSVGAGDGASLGIGGPSAALTPKAAEAIGLAVHELTTNALKYGALKSPEARLDIDWKIHPEDGTGGRLTLVWKESGVPAVPEKPERRGFGTELITEALPYQLGAETRLDFGGDGICATISMPLPDAVETRARAWEDD